MPFYEYQCASCGHQLEVLQKISDAPLRKCPNCGKSQLKRLISAPVFRLKGSGWYETDFKSDKESKRNLVESAEKESSDSKDTAKPETSAEKPAASDAKPKVEDKPAAKPAPATSAPKRSKAKPVSKVKKKAGKR